MIGVIPAGGHSQRFMGIHKEMLPTGKGTFLITDAMERARQLGADRCVIISSAEKASFHERFLRANDSLLVSTNLGLWAAIQATFPFHDDSVLVLPDTTFTLVDPLPVAPISFGIFPTEESHRYSILVNNVIITKPVGVVTTQSAWGCVGWTPEVIDFWADKIYDHYDHAFNAAIDVFGHKTFAIADYQDLGDWDSYARFIRNHHELSS